MQRVRLFGAVSVAGGLLAGCVYNFGLKPETTPEVELAVASTDRTAHESKTLSNLATLEVAVQDYLKAEGKIPGDLQDLIPKYISEIPPVELGIPEHKDSAKVAYYAPEIIRDGVIDGTKIQDTGNWGYAHTDRQVIIFVDCLHQSSRKKAWYQERGVF